MGLVADFSLWLFPVHNRCSSRAELGANFDRLSHIIVPRLDS